MTPPRRNRRRPAKEMMTISDNGDGAPSPYNRSKAEAAGPLSSSPPHQIAGGARGPGRSAAARLRHGTGRPSAALPAERGGVGWGGKLGTDPAQATPEHPPRLPHYHDALSVLPAPDPRGRAALPLPHMVRPVPRPRCLCAPGPHRSPPLPFPPPPPRPAAGAQGAGAQPAPPLGPAARPPPPGRGSRSGAGGPAVAGRGGGDAQRGPAPGQPAEPRVRPGEGGSAARPPARF